MALTVSHISAFFVKDTKTIGKQSAYLDFDFGGRVHSTDVLKSTGKNATWDTPVQLTGAGVMMKIIAKASKTLGSDKALGIAEINVLETANKGTQTVRLKSELTNEFAGEVTLQISGGSPAISGLPHQQGAVGALEAHLPGHSDPTTSGTGTGAGGQGLTTGGQGGQAGQAGLAGAGAGAAGATALQQQGQSPNQSFTQRTEDQVLPGGQQGGQAGYGGQGGQAGYGGQGGQAGYGGQGGQAGYGGQGGQAGYGGDGGQAGYGQQQSFGGQSSPGGGGGGVYGAGGNQSFSNNQTSPGGGGYAQQGSFGGGGAGGGCAACGSGGTGQGQYGTGAGGESCPSCGTSIGQRLQQGLNLGGGGQQAGYGGQQAGGY